jgi:hypothetical protein
VQWQNSLSTSFIFLRTAVHHGHRDRRRQYVEVGEPSMITQLSDDAEYWQELAEETRREVDRITNLRNLLNLKDLAEKAEECDRKALLAKRWLLMGWFGRAPTPLAREAGKGARKSRSTPCCRNCRSATRTIPDRVHDSRRRHPAWPRRGVTTGATSLIPHHSVTKGWEPAWPV